MHSAEQVSKLGAMVSSPNTPTPTPKHTPRQVSKLGAMVTSQLTQSGDLQHV